MNEKEGACPGPTTNTTKSGVVGEDNKLSPKRTLRRAWLEGRNPDINRYSIIQARKRRRSA